MEDVTSETSRDISYDLSKSLQDIGKGLQNAHGEVELDKYDILCEIMKLRIISYTLGRFSDQLPGKALVVALSTSDSFFTLQVVL